MSITEIIPSKERTIITAAPGTTYYPPFRGISVDVAGTVTIQLTERESTPVAVYLAAGVIHQITFDILSAVSGPTSVVAHR